MLREESVLGVWGLRATFKSKILTLSSLNFLKFLLIIGTYVYYFEIYEIWVCVWLMGFVFWVTMEEEMFTSVTILPWFVKTKSLPMRVVIVFDFIDFCLYF